MPSSDFPQSDAPSPSRGEGSNSDVPRQTPGAVLMRDFLQPSGLSQSGLARAIGVSPRRINEIILGKRMITADTDLRLSAYWGMEPGMWLGLQMEHDLDMARARLAPALARIVPKAS